MSGWGRHGTNKSNLEEFPGPLTEFHNFLNCNCFFCNLADLYARQCFCWFVLWTRLLKAGSSLLKFIENSYFGKRISTSGASDNKTRWTNPGENMWFWTQIVMWVADSVWNVLVVVRWKRTIPQTQQFFVTGRCVCRTVCCFWSCCHLNCHVWFRAPHRSPQSLILPWQDTSRRSWFHIVSKEICRSRRVAENHGEIKKIMSSFWGAYIFKFLGCPTLHFQTNILPFTHAY